MCSDSDPYTHALSALSRLQYAYDAELAGMSYACNHTTYGLDITVAGYHQNLESFLMVLLEQLQNLTLSPDRFPLIKEQCTSSPFDLDASGCLVPLCLPTLFLSATIAFGTLSFQSAGFFL